MAVDASGSATGIQRRSGYADFQAGEGIPIYGGFAVDDVRTLDLGSWARTGGLGAFVDLEGTGGANAAYVAEIPPGKSLNPQRHMYEEVIYVIEGSGSTSVWYNEDNKLSFEWKEGSLFSIPLNAWHRHYNAQGARPARYLAVTTAPIVMNLFHSERFIFDNAFVFEDRFDGRSDYFNSEELHIDPGGGQHVFLTNFVADIHRMQLYARPARGAGGRMAFFELADNTLCAHISEFPVGTYKKGHRHGPGAHVVILDGQGFSLLWPEGEERREVLWRRGSMVVPPDRWFHQHFNTGDAPARYLAIRWGSKKHNAGRALNSAEEERGGPVRESRSSRDVRQGGDQIEYDGEDRVIHQRFEEALSQKGVTCRMRAMVPWCTGTE